MENVNVVIVDDNPMILNTLDEMISSEAGLSVIGRADNGKDAIDMIKDTEPDVVLLDLVMPRVDGITVVENIKKNAELRESKIYLVTSSITNLVFLFIIGVSPIFGELPEIIAIALAVGTFFNLFCVLYFSKRYMMLSNSQWKTRTTRQKMWSILLSVALVIIIFAIIFFIRFKYNAF